MNMLGWLLDDGDLRKLHRMRVNRTAGKRSGQIMSIPDEPIPSHDARHMRRNGVRGLFVTCLHCGYQHRRLAG
jgi:hypothetical protein